MTMQTEWGKADVLYLDDDARFYPHRTIGLRLVRGNCFAACICNGGSVTYEQAQAAWREMDAKLRDTVNCDQP